MPNENINTTLRFDADITDFKAAMQEATRATKLANSEFKAVSAGMDDWAGSTDGLSAKLSQLATKQQAEERKLAVLKEAYRAVVKEQGENSAAAVDLATKINNQQAVVNKTAKEYERYSAKLEEVEQGADSTGDALEDMGAAAEKSSGGWTVLKDVVADFVSNTLQSAIEAVKNFAIDTINMGKEFDSQMSRVSAISGATGDELTRLRDVAKELGASTTFSASQAAEGMENLASAGFEVGEIIEAMPGMLDLAASSGENLATASDIAASTLRGFGLEADRAGHVADVLAKNAAATNAAVSDTGEAMKYIAPIAHTAGLSMEEVAASIGILADSGIKGSQAGTTLRGALSSLARPSGPAAEKMAELGLEFYNTSGEMKSMQDIIAMLNEKMSGLTEQQQQNALVTIFGQEALSGMSVLMEAGSEKLGTLTESYKNADGAAAEMAKTMTDNLGGKLEAFGGNLETVQLAMYEKLEPALKRGVDMLNKLVDAVAWVVEHNGEFAAVLAGMATAVATYVAYNAALTVFKNGWMALTVVQKTAAAAQAALNLVMSANPIGIVIALLASLIAIVVTAYKTSDTFREKVDKVWAALKKNGGAAVEWVVKKFGDMVTWFKELPGKISSAISGAVDKVVSWGSSLVSKGKQAASSLVSAVVDTVKSLPGKMLSIGSDLAAGVWEGMSNSLSWIKNKISGWVGNVKDFLLNLFDINSPSGWARDFIGFNIGAGAAVGLEDSFARVKQSSRKLKEVIGDTIDVGPFGSPSPQGVAAGGRTIIFNQTNNSPRALSRREIYRQTHNALAFAGGV